MGQNSDAVLVSAVSYFAQVLLHPAGHRQLVDDFEDSSWFLWLNLASEFLLELEKKNLIPSDILPAKILYSTKIDVFKKELIFDLGPHLSLSEAELIHRISQTHSVSVIAPAVDWIEINAHLLEPYRFLISQTEKSNRLELQANITQEVVSARLTSPLAEVKQATALIRQWLDSGVTSERILVLAPNIENYWPLLRRFLEVEGVPTQKSEKVSLHAFPEVQSFLARVRMDLNDVNFNDLETVFYQRQAQPISYEEFYRRFSSLLDAVDLGRHREIYEQFKQSRGLEGSADTATFIGYLLKLASNLPWSEELHLLLKSTLGELPSAANLSSAVWLHLLESMAKKIEVSVAAGNPAGISCQNYFSGDAVGFTHRIYLGLTESATKDKRLGFCDGKTVAKLFQDYGFFVQSVDQTAIEFSIHWQLEKCSGVFFLSFPENTFEGEAETPSVLWLKRSGVLQNQEILHEPAATRWDELMSQEFPYEPAQEADFGKPDITRLSASAIESYLQCPFIYASKYLFRLEDQGLYDLDIQPMEQGVLIHALFENLIDQNGVKKVSESDVLSMIDEMAVSHQLFVGDRSVWAIYRSRLKDLVLRFLEFEKQWRRDYPETKTIAKEVDIHGRIQGIEIRGKIDRVDQDAEGHLVVMDYKSSKGDLVLSKNALEKNQIQLLFYVWALMQSWVPDLSGKKVAAATYYFFKTLARDSGFKIKPVNPKMLPEKGGAALDTASFDALMRALEEKVMETIQALKAGHFAPKPEDQKICTSCKWRRLCRAPHLQN